MNNERKIFITAEELSELMGVSLGHAYKLIRGMNKDLKDTGYLVIAGKVPKAYFEQKLFGYTANGGAI